VRGARPERAVERILEQRDVVRKGERVLIACSGGPDSVALAYALHKVSEPMKLELAMAHVNHNTRASAWQDQCVVMRVAATCELPLATTVLDGANRDEASMRDARYAALVTAAHRFNATLVVTGHNAEDQSESVLLALFRGSGSDGLGGIRARRTLSPGVDLGRPFLRVPGETLRAYCHAYALPYAVDPTNADASLRRNAVRTALEALRPLFPGLDEAVSRAAALVADEHDSVERAELRRAVRERLAREDELRDVDFQHVEAAVRALEAGTSGTFHMKAGVRLEIVRGAIAGISRL
jgi:tRNA(Ile)-lysidine synthase